MTEYRSVPLRGHHGESITVPRTMSGPAWDALPSEVRNLSSLLVHVSQLLLRLSVPPFVPPSVRLSLQTRMRYLRYLTREVDFYKKEAESERARRLAIQGRLERCLELPDNIATKSLETLRNLEETLLLKEVSLPVVLRHHT